MATQQVTISASSLNTLKKIVAQGKTEIEGNFDKRSIRALSTRDLVKVIENKKGTFVAPTAKGKKFLN